MSDTSQNDPRIDQLLEVLLAFARQDFSKHAPIGDGLDEIDAIAAGLNMLAEELHGAVASRRELEVAYSALKETQGKLLHRGKLVAIGQIASGVAHEINNPSSWVSLSVDLLAERIADVRARLADASLDGAQLRNAVGTVLAEMEQNVNHARNGMDRIRAIAGDLRTFSRADGDGFEAVSLNDVVEAACRLAGPSLRSSAQVKLVLSSEVPHVDGNRGRLAQVVTNLLVNAAQAVAEAGGPDNEVTVHTRIDGQHALLVVEDTGPGISPALRERIFEPFFTTKSPELGTGLGLSMVTEIVRGHHGVVAVSASASGGARFEVRLPHRPAARPLSEAAVNPTVDKRARVLIVDDETKLLLTYEILLKGVHDVVTASCGEQALRILANDRSFDVVLCDLQMPGVDGVQVFQRATAIAPELASRFVFSTGGGVEPHICAFMATTQMPILEKPVRVEALLDRLQRSQLIKGFLPSRTAPSRS